MNDPAIDTRSFKALGHFALHYRPGESALVVRLFQCLGFRVEDFGPSLDGLLVSESVSSPYIDRCYRVFINTESSDGFVFICTATRAQLALEDALAAAGLPALGAYKDARRDDPEASFHLTIRYASLESLEHALEKLDDAVRTAPGFKKRVRIKRMKAFSPTDPSVGTRMAASPVFTAEDPDSYAEKVVQVFIETDIAAGSLLTLGQIIELDYIFPGPMALYPPVKVYEPC
jgi:hypothetical protein